MDKLAALRLFRRVAEEGGFSAAARSLGVSTALVSKTVRQLEDALGTRLLVRSTRAVQLTEAGARYLHSIAPLLDELTLADQSLRHRPVGELRVSAPVDLAEHLLPGVLAAYRARCPDVTVTLDLTGRQVDLHHEPIDLALRLGQVSQGSLVARPLARLPLMLCAAPDYLTRRGTPRHPRDLASHDCLLNPTVGDPHRWRFQQGGRVFSVTANAVLRANSVRLLVRAAEAGQGLLYLPAYLLDDAVTTGRLVPLLADFLLPPRPLSVVYPERRFLPEKTRLFIDLLVEAFAHSPDASRVLPP